MTIQTILYAASGGSAGEGAAELACLLARRFGAHIEGFHVRADPRQAALAFGDGFGSPVVGDLIERTEQEVTEVTRDGKRYRRETNTMPHSTRPSARTRCRCGRSRRFSSPAPLRLWSRVPLGARRPALPASSCLAGAGSSIWLCSAAPSAWSTSPIRTSSRTR